MEKEFVPYEIALALKELGFNEPCFGWYNWTGTELFLTNNRYIDIDINPTEAPLYQQVFEWFREQHKLEVCFRKHDYGDESNFTGYYYSIYEGNNLIEVHGADRRSKIYREAEIACIEKLIELLKESV